MKLVLKIFNLAYIVLAAVACVALLTAPIVQIDASIRAPKEQAVELIYPMFEGQGIEKADFEVAFEKSLDENKTIGFDLNLSLPATSTISKDASEITKSLTDQVNTTVDQIVKNLNPTVKELAKLIAKKAGKDAIKDSIAKQIDTTNPGQSAQIMQDCGITDEYIDNMTEDVLNSLLGNEEEGVEAVKTVDELMDRIDGNISDVCHKLSEGEVAGYEPDGLDEKIASMNDDIEKQLKDALLEAKLCDEDGNINDVDAAIDELLATFLDGLMNGDSSSDPATKAAPIRVLADDGSEEQESKLNAKIREFLTQKIEEFNINGIVEQFWFVPLIITFGLMLPWLIFILITLIRTLRKKKVWTKSWVIFVFAILQVVFGLALYIATASFTTQILDIIPLPDNPAIEIVRASSLSIQTSTFIPSILYLVMIPMTIVYMVLAHKVKKDYKSEKKGKKKSKKEKVEAPTAA